MRLWDLKTGNIPSLADPSVFLLEMKADSEGKRGREGRDLAKQSVHQ